MEHEMLTNPVKGYSGQVCDILFYVLLSLNANAQRDLTIVFPCVCLSVCLFVTALTATDVFWQQERQLDFDSWVSKM